MEDFASLLVEQFVQRMRVARAQRLAAARTQTATPVRPSFGAPARAVPAQAAPAPPARPAPPAPPVRQPPARPKPVSPAGLPPDPFATHAAVAPSSNPLLSAFASRGGLLAGIVLGEALGPPLALRPHEPGRS